MLEVLHIDQDSTLQFLWDQRPTYLQFEEWVTAEGTHEDARIARWNKSLVPRTHYRPDKIDETYGDIGWSPEETTEVSAVLLNCLQDWHLFHRRVFAPGASGLPGSRSSYPQQHRPRATLGICQLPRTWLKTCLRAKGLAASRLPRLRRGQSRPALLADLAGGSGRGPDLSPPNDADLSRV